MMAARRRAGRGASAPRHARYTVDASVFVSAFNPAEAGHAGSAALMSALQASGDPIIVPSLLVAEVAAAMARLTDDTAGARTYATALAKVPGMTLVSLTPLLARQAAELAAVHRLRGADAVYVAVARRYGTVLVTRDAEQRARSADAVTTLTPGEALKAMPGLKPRPTSSSPSPAAPR